MEYLYVVVTFVILSIINFLFKNYFTNTSNGITNPSNTFNNRKKKPLNITLRCLVLGKQPASLNAFQVKINTGQTVKELKEVIKNNNTPDFDKLTAKDLRLWKVRIPDNRDDLISSINRDLIDDESDEDLIDEESMNNKVDKVDLLATRYIDDYWTDVPPKRYIHVIIEPPKHVIFIPANGTPEVRYLSVSTRPNQILDCEFAEGCAVMSSLPGYALSMFIESSAINPSRNLPKNLSATRILSYRRGGNDTVLGNVVLCDDFKNLSLDDYRRILSVASR